MNPEKPASKAGQIFRRFLSFAKCGQLPFLSRHREAIGLVTPAVLFVPVPFWYGLVDYIAPVSFILGGCVLSLGRSKISEIPIILIEPVIYLALFIMLARFLHAGLWRVRWPGLKWSLYAGLVVAIFLCSFLRVIRREDLRGRSGTYNFWTALPKVFERWGLSQ